MRVNNLYDLHKKRVAEITNDHKQLVVNFEMKHPIGLKGKKFKDDISSSFLNCEILLNYNKPKLSIKVKQTEPDLGKLYKIFLSIAYLLGDEISLYYFYKNLPYYPVPHYFNFGNYSFCFVNNKKLITDTKLIIEQCYKLLVDNETCFSKIVPVLLNINSMNYSDVRFFSEFSLLESLARDYKVSGNIFDLKKDKKSLKKFSTEILSYINKSNYDIIKDTTFKQKINNILSPKTLNEKGVSKDKMIGYIESFKSKEITNYSKYVDAWNKLRSKKGLAHGNLFIKKINKEDSLDREIRNKLHQLLSDIVFEELKNNI